MFRNPMADFVSTLTFLSVPLVAACARSGAARSAADTLPRIDPSAFSSTVTNPYFPLAPGTVYRFRGTADAGDESNVVTVTHDTREALGIRATVVHDQGFEDGELAEDTYDWYAQDGEGNVWYLGEDSREIRDGRVVSRAGSWEAGVGGAQAGIIMWADPAAHVGERYRQEHLPGWRKTRAR